MEARGLLALGVSLCLLFFPRIAPPPGRWWEAAWDALHVPGFFIITWGIEHLLSHVIARRGARVAWAAAGALVIAAGSEMVHNALGRSSSVGDFERDLIGTGYAALVLLAGPRCGRRGRAGLGIAGVVVMTLLFVPAMRESVATRRHREHFPDLGAFADDSCLAVWKPQGNARVVRLPEKSALAVEIGPGRWGGVSFSPSQPDWSGRGALVLEIENPGTEAFELGVRIDDDLTERSPGRTRWEEGREIPPGRVKLRIPLAEIARGPADRLLDLGRIHRVALYTDTETAGRTFLIDSAFLE